MPDPEPDPAPGAPTAPTPDTDDHDNIPAAVENAAIGLAPTPGVVAVAGDGNGDGIPDGQQAEVTSLAILRTSTAQSHPGDAPKVYVSLVADSIDGKVNTVNSSNAQIKSVVQEDAPLSASPELVMPLGLLNFTVSMNHAAITETFSLYVDPTLGANGYWVESANHVWTNLASAAYGGKIVQEGDKTRLDFVVADGGEFDADGVSNGSVGNLGAAAHMPLSLVGFAPIVPAGGWFGG